MLNFRRAWRARLSDQVGSTVGGAGNVLLQVGNDVNLTAANVNAGNAIAVQARRDINSSVAVDVRTADTSYAGGKSSGEVSASDEAVQGTQISAKERCQAHFW